MSLVERVRAKKRESEREEEKASLLNENMGLADRIRNRASIDSDSLERDIKNFEAEYNTAKKWWHNAEDMSNLRNKAESIQNRVNAYANSGSYIKGLDAGSLVNKYSTVLDDIDILSNKYSMYDSKDAYKPSDVNRDELISIGKSKQNIFSDNPSIQQMLRSENDNGIYDLMTDDEKNEFYYQTGKLGTSGGNEYLKGLDSVLKKRAYESSASKMKESSESSAVESVVNNLASSFGVGYGYVDDLVRTATGRDIDEYNIGHLLSEIEESSREATKQHARETFGESAVTDFLVDTGLSIGQSAVRLPLGNVGLAVAGLGAATQGAESARERGASDWQALFAGGAQGIAEAAMERVSFGGLEKILTETPIYTVKDIVKNTLRQMGREAGEESLTEFVNTISDLLIMGDKSQAIASMNDYIANGYDVDTARNKVIGDVFKNTVLSGLGGALSGGVMGSTFSGINAYGQYTAGKNSNITDYNEFAESLDTNPESYENAKDLEKVENLKAYAQELADAQAKGEKVTNLQKGAFERDLYNMENDLIESQKANDPEVKREKRVESLKKGEVTEVTATGNSTRLGGLRFKDGKTMLQTSEGEYAAEDMTLTQNDAELVSYAESMSEEKANLLVAQYDGKTNVGDYVESFNLAYSYGETGFGTDFVLKNKGVLTERQALNAYKEATMAKARKNSEAFVNAVDKTITREMLGGRFDDSIIDYDGSGKGTVKWNMLTSSEKMNINAAKVIAGAMKNTKFEFIESRVENGEYKGENARWNPTTRTISIDVHAGRNKLTDENSYIMSAMSHEITHSFERTAAEEYANLRDHVMNYLANRNGIDASELIARKRMQIGDSHAKRGIELTDERVINEIVADACEEMLVNSKKVDEYLKGMDEHTKKSFVGKVKETFENIIKAINDVIKKLDPRTKEARALRESKEDFEKTLELWDKAFVKANESHVESISTDIEINDSLNEIGLEFDSETKTVFSLRSLEDAFNYNDAEGYLRSREEYVNALVKATGRTKAEAERYLNSLFLVHDMIARDKDRLDYEAAVNRTAWVSNSEYGGSIDFSTLCAKRRIFTGTFDAIQNALPNTVLTDKDYLEIRNLLLKKGKESPCSMCYVEGSRAKAGEYINKWLQEYLKTNPKWRPRIADFASATGLEKTRIQHPEAYNAYQEAMNKLAQRKPKEASVRTDYKGEILVAFSDGSSVEIKNLNGGIRFNSFSDFEIVHTLDCMQVIADMARVGLAGQGYTKVKEFAKCFGNTGMKINLSLVAKDVDANGKLIMDEVNGMSYKDAMELRNEFSENVGTVIVCFNVDQIKAAMADDTIDYILPFHRSQWRKAQYAAMGLPTKTKDFTMFQNDRIRNPKTGRPVKLEKLKHISRYTNDITGESYEIKGNIMPNQYWDYTKSGRENAQRYLDYINQNGMTPKFDFVLEKADGKWVLPNNAIGDGYFKLLIDFKMYNNDGVGTPQLPVTPEFNMPYIEQMLEDYKGGHGSFPVAHDVVDEFVEGYKKNHPKAQYSDRINTEEQLSTFNLEGKWNDYIGVQKEVVKVLKNEGFFDNNSVVNEDSGMEVKINAKGVRETLSSGNRFQTLPKELKRYKVATIRKLPDLIRTGKLLDDNVKNSHDPNGYRYAYIENNAIVDDKVVGVRIAIKKKVNTNYFWIHNIDTNEKNSELLSPSVRTVLNETRSSDKTVTQDEIKVNIQFSDRYDDVWFDLFDEDGSMAASSAIIDEDVERLRERLSMGASSMSDANIQMIAKHLRKIADSSYDNDELMDELKDIYGYIEHHDYFDGNALVSKCNDVARRILSEQREHKVTNDYAKMVLKDIRATKIKLNAEQIAEAKNRYGEKYRNALFGRITISNEGISLDSKWQEWSGQYPSIFSADVNSADMINELADIYDSLREASETGQRFAEVNDVRALGAEIYNQYWIRSTISAESEKNQQKIKELNFKHRDAMKRLREDYKKRVENQKIADSMHYGKVIREIRQKKDAEIAKAKKLGKEHMDKYKENVQKNELVNRITNKAMKMNEQLTTNSKEKHISEPMKKIVGEFLLSIDFSSKAKLSKGNSTQKDIRFDRALRKVKDMMESSNKAVSDDESDSTYYGAVFPPNLISVVNDLVNSVELVVPTGESFVLNQMSVEELKNLNTLVDILRSAVMQADMVISSDNKERISDLAEKDIKHHDELGTAKTYDGLVGSVHRGIVWRNILPSFAFKRFGPGAQKIFKAFMDGWDKLAFHAKEIIDFTEKLYSDKEIQEWKREVRSFKLSNGREIQMTTPQIMALYCLSHREQARKHMFHEDGYNGKGIRVNDFKDGRKVVRQVKETAVTQKEVEQIVSTLTKKQRDVADALQNFMQTVCSRWGNETTMKLYGIRMMEDGYYFPIKTDSNDRPSEPGEKENTIYRLLNMSFTKAVNEHATNPIVIEDIFDVFARHSSDMAKYNALAIPVYDAFRWYSFKGEINGENVRMKTSLENAFGSDGKSYIYTFLKDINGVEKIGRVDLAKKFFTNAKIASVGTNLRVAALQPFAYARAGLVIDLRYLRKAFGHKPKTKYAKDHCGIALWKSLGYYDTNIQKGLAEQIKHDQKRKDKITEWSMLLAGKMDELTWGYLWNACELEVRDKRKDLKVGSDEFFKVVGERLRDVIYSTQVVDSTMTRSEFMRSGDGLDQMATAFMSEPTVSYNILADAITEWNLTLRKTGSKQEAFKKNGKHLQRAFMTYAASGILTSLVEALMDLYRDTEEEEEDKVVYAEAFIMNMIDNLNPVGMIPYMKEGTSAMINMVRLMYTSLGLPTDTTIGKVLKKYTTYSSSRTETQWIDYLNYASTGMEKMISGSGKTSAYTAFKNLLKAFSSATGVSAYNAWREITTFTHKTGIWTMDEIEEMFDETIGDFLRGK